MKALAQTNSEMAEIEVSDWDPMKYMDSDDDLVFYFQETFTYNNVKMTLNAIQNVAKYKHNESVLRSVKALLKSNDVSDESIKSLVNQLGFIVDGNNSVEIKFCDFRPVLNNVKPLNKQVAWA
jgi:hypothetical protein